MSASGIQWLGWCATAVFVCSYFWSQPSRLRALQMLGALLWIAYGVLIASPPVVVANVLVFSAAAWTAWRAQPATGAAALARAASSSGSR